MISATLRSARNLIAAMLTAAALLVVPLGAQTAPSSRIANRLTVPVDERSLVTLHGAVSPLAKAANDLGAVADDMQLQRLHLVLKRSAAQENTLRQLIVDMHTHGSASYHQWLTPEQFGAQFGPTDQDIATVESWLASHGFQVSEVKPGKQVLEFSGSVAQLREAFHTSIHKYSLNGESHYANANDPQIPSALAPVVGGFVSLNNFRVKNHSRVLGQAIYNPKTHTARPEWTYGDSSGFSFPLAPADFAIQYDLNPLYNASVPVNGSGQTIAVINDSNINVEFVNQFRSLFGLSVNPPQVILDGNDPGIDGINNPDGPNYDSFEAYLDVEWSGAVAPAATIDLVIGADTVLENGLILAAEHAVYGNLAPVMSLSFGECEGDLGSTDGFFNSLWEQAAAQGITVLVSTGDSGSAGCDNDNTQYYAVNGLGVNGLASTPYDIAVGGTDFYYSDYNNSNLNAQVETYWNTTPTQQPQASLLRVVPEQPWNDSQYGLNVIDYYSVLGSSQQTIIAAGSGGISDSGDCSTNTYDDGYCVGAIVGYPKPSWQTATGVPADEVRDLPDLSLFAANGQNYSYYAVCAEDGDCQPPSGSNLVQISGVGGTSASVQVFAGMMALVNQKYGRQGQADFVLYPLKAQFPAAFHDVTQGTISVPCAYLPSSPDCIAVANALTVTDPNYGQAVEGELGSGTTADYNASAGYNLATGLGTVDANVLVTNWNNVSSATTTTTLTPSATTLTHGSSITIDGSVSGSGTPTGDVALMTDSQTPLNQGQTFFTLSNGGFSATNVNYLPGGTYNIWGRYGGDGNNAASSSAKTQITVNPEASSTAFNIYDVATPSTGTAPIASGATNIPYGTQLILDAKAAPTTSSTYFGYPTGTVAFADKGTTINTAVINVEGDAEYNAPWSVGSHSVTAAYSGDASYNASSASAITFSIARDTPAITLSSAAGTSGIYPGGEKTVLTIQVENSANLYNEDDYGIGYSNPAVAPTGSVSVSGLPSGVPTSATLSAAVDPSTYSPEGVATIVAPANTPTGSYTATIHYGGDANYAATSNSASVMLTATTGMASTTTASFSGSISPTTSITVTGTVTGQSGQAAPGGYVLFFSSGYQLYSLGEVAITAGSGDSSSFSATLNSQTLFQGTNLITVQYLGDNNYAQSSTTLNPIASPLSDFLLVPQAATVPIAAGAAATDTVNVISGNGFSGTINFTCSAAPGMTCSVPASVALSSGGSAVIPLTLTASSSASGSYNVLLTATSGSFVHTLGIQTIVSQSASSVTPSVTAANKTYDGTTTEPVSQVTCTLTPSASNLTCLAAAATFATPGVGNRITVTATGIALGGSAAFNYSLATTTATTTANISQATPVLGVTCGGGTYNSTAYSCTGSATGVSGATVAGMFTFSPVSETNAGSYPVTGTFTSSDTNYVSGGTASGTLTIAQAIPTLSVTCAGGTTYTGHSFPSCAASATGIGGAPVAGTWLITYSGIDGTSYGPSTTGPTNAGTYQVAVSFTSDNADYANGTASSTLTITPATPVVAVTCPGATYDGNAHGCTATATGVGVDGNITTQGTFSWSPAQSETSTGNYTITATFSSTNSNYNNSGSGSATLTIQTAATLVPSIAGITPASATAGAATLAIAVSGTNFDSNAVIEWNGTALTTTWTSPTQLTAPVPAASLSAIGVASITVLNPAPSAGAASASSGTFQFAIDSSASTAGTVTVTSSITAVTVQPGETTTVPVSFAGANSNAAITVNCVNLPAGATCTYANGTVTITAGSNTSAGTYPVTIIFTTTQTVASRFHERIFLAAWSGILGLPLGLLWVGGGRKRNLRRFLLAFLGMALLLSLVGCGGKSAPSTSTSTSNPNTSTSTASTVTSQSSVAVTLSVI
jgi:hypothetical protein